MNKNKKRGRESRQALVYLWTGRGWGKTTSALGVALRQVGHGNKVIILQFMKGWKERIGEYRVRKRLAPEYEIRQFGRVGWVNLTRPAEIDKKLARKGLEFAKKAAGRKPALLILDEINLAVAIGLLAEKEVIDFLNSVPPEVIVYLTGRFATKGLLKRADYVTEVIPVKHPKVLAPRKGIDY